MKYGSILRPFTMYRPEYFDGLAKEAVADHIQLEANLEYLASLSPGWVTPGHSPELVSKGRDSRRGGGRGHV